MVQEERTGIAIPGTALLTSSCPPVRLFEIKRWGSLSKAMRVVGWVLWFLGNIQSSSENRSAGDLTFPGLCKARSHCYKTYSAVSILRSWSLSTMVRLFKKKYPIHKLSPFLCDEGLLRVQGCLQYSNLPEEEKHPVIVPKGHLGLLMPRHPPFSVTGLDCAGPRYCCDFPGKKFLLFTCAVVRALHLELVSSLSCDETMLALRRFIFRRGMPLVCMSDNAKCFQAAAVQKLRILGPEGPEWKFIAPVPLRGRMVGKVDEEH